MANKMQYTQKSSSSSSQSILCALSYSRNSVLQLPFARSHSESKLIVNDPTPSDSEDENSWISASSDSPSYSRSKFSISGGWMELESQSLLRDDEVEFEPLSVRERSLIDCLSTTTLEKFFFRLETYCACCRPLLFSGLLFSFLVQSCCGGQTQKDCTFFLKLGRGVWSSMLLSVRFYSQDFSILQSGVGLLDLRELSGPEEAEGDFFSGDPFFTGQNFSFSNCRGVQYFFPQANPAAPPALLKSHRCLVFEVMSVIFTAKLNRLQIIMNAASFVNYRTAPETHKSFFSLL